MRNWQGTTFFVIAAVCLCEIFSEVPFIQHEMVGQAFWWTQDKISLWELFFDSHRMDCHLGRFRYLEYLVQAIYWNLMAKGWLPRDFYDFFAIPLSLASAFLLWRLAKQRGVSPVISLMLVAIFLFSAPVYMVHLFHFRKAKFIASFFLLVLLYLNRTQWKSSGVLIFTMSLLGVMVDVYFILLSIPVMLADDYVLKRKNIPGALRTFFGLMAGGIVTLYFSNVIGRSFSRNSGIGLGVPEGIPTTFLKWQNIPQFPYVLPDLLAPNLFTETYSLVAYGGVLFLVLSIVILIRNQKVRPGWMALFLFSLPIAAFCLQPRRDWVYFTGYYGHTFFVFLVLALTEWVVYLQQFEKWGKVTASLCCLLILLCHLVGKPYSLESWKRVYSSSELAEGRALEDYKLMQEVRQRLNAGENPVEITLDSSKVSFVNIADGRIYDGGKNWDHTNVAYFFLPAAFKKEFEEGRFRIKLIKPEPHIVTVAVTE